MLLLDPGKEQAERCPLAVILWCGAFKDDSAAAVLLLKKRLIAFDMASSICRTSGPPVL
jgi:hypothetical protein